MILIGFTVRIHLQYWHIGSNQIFDHSIEAERVRMKVKKKKKPYRHDFRCIHSSRYFERAILSLDREKLVTRKIRIECKFWIRGASTPRFISALSFFDTFTTVGHHRIKVIHTTLVSKIKPRGKVTR